ncbi:MAG: hypothetical protein HQL74_14190 [Magnetococcales bacterium]|nr:hypothetical protein [Magnetococcales bacterium]
MDDSEGVRGRAVNLLLAIAQKAAQQCGDSSGLDESEKAKMRGPFTILEKIITQLYITSGASAAANGGEPNTQRIRLFRELKEVFQLLAENSQGWETTNLLETMEYFIPVEPEVVFDLMNTTLNAAQKGGYAYNSMGADQMVRMVGRYLADYRPLFQTNPQRREQLLSVLDLFIRAGWPQARRLVYRLTDIFA